MTALFWLIIQIISLVIWAILIQVILSLLISFGVINGYQPFVRSVYGFLTSVTEPLLAPIRRLLWRILPSTGNIDLSPLIALLLLQALQIFIRTTIAAPMGIYV